MDGSWFTNPVVPYRKPGMNGFRVWLTPRRDDHLVECDCRWPERFGQPSCVHSGDKGIAHTMVDLKFERFASTNYCDLCEQPAKPHYVSPDTAESIAPGLIVCDDCFDGIDSNERARREAKSVGAKHARRRSNRGGTGDTEQAKEEGI
jgi:hypothetical protein